MIIIRLDEEKYTVKRNGCEYIGQIRYPKFCQIFINLPKKKKKKNEILSQYFIFHSMYVAKKKKKKNKIK